MVRPKYLFFGVAPPIFSKDSFFILNKSRKIEKGRGKLWGTWRDSERSKRLQLEVSVFDQIWTRKVISNDFWMSHVRLDTIALRDTSGRVYTFVRWPTDFSGVEFPSLARTCSRTDTELRFVILRKISNLVFWEFSPKLSRANRGPRLKERCEQIDLLWIWNFRTNVIAASRTKMWFVHKNAFFLWGII